MIPLFDQEVAVSVQGIVYILAIGLGVMALGGAMLTYCLLNARSSNIGLYYYMVPVLAVVLLSAFDAEVLTLPIIFGGAVTVLSCVALMFKRPSANMRSSQSKQ